MYKTFCTIEDKLNIPVEEAYRVLRTNIQFCGVGSRLKTVAVVSSNSGDGKTATALNLAISMAKSGERTLLVDADMHKSDRVKNIHGSMAKGLSHYLMGNAELNEIISDTNIKNLYFITNGPDLPNAAELICSSKFNQFIDETCREFNMVIFDTPPLRSAIDSALISSKVDGTLIVIKSKTPYDHNLIRLKNQLLKANARILGVVLNKIPKREYKKYYDSTYKRRKRKKKIDFDENSAFDKKAIAT